MSLNVSSAQDFSVKQLSAGSYIYRKAYHEGNLPTISSSSVTNADYILPNQVINLFRSYLCFEYRIVGGNDTIRNAAHNGFLAPIDGITLSTAAGTKIVELNNVPHYTKLVWKPFTEQSKMLTLPCHSTATGVLTSAACLEYGQLFNRVRDLSPDTAAADATFAAAAYVPAAEDGKTWVEASDDYTAVATHIIATGAAAAAVNTGTAEEKAAAAALNDVVVKVRLPLSMLYGSLFAVDKDLYFNEQLRLTVRYNQSSKFGWATGAAATAVANAVRNDVANTVLSNSYVHVAIENNDVIAQAIKEKVLMSDGINLITPFTYAYRASTTGAGSHQFIRKLNRGHGSRLLRVVSGVFSNSEVGPLYCNNNNLGTLAAPLKWNSIRTNLNSEPITEDYQVISEHNPYLRHADFYKGSCIKDFSDWLKNAVIIEDFTGVRRGIDVPEADTMVSGLDLSTENEFMLELNQVSAGALPVYMFSTCLKNLSINRSGISIL